MSKQISAVEWLFEQVWINPVSKLPEILDQAKQMEKEQIYHAYRHAQDFDDNEYTYYNETFGNSESVD